MRDALATKVLRANPYPADLVWFFDTYDVWVPDSTFSYLIEEEDHPNSYRIDLFCFLYLLGIKPA